MSSEEDTELRDLVAQTLEVNGCLPKIRAELRASIFLALEEDEELQKNERLHNKKVKSSLESQEGRAMFCLVREFLEFFDLDFTISVYEPESYLGTAYQYGGRSKLVEDLGISQLKENATLPLLLQLIKLAQLNSVQTKNIDINLKLPNDETVEEITSSAQSNTMEENNGSNSVSEEWEQSREKSINGVLSPIIEIHGTARNVNLNETFNLSSSSIKPNDMKKAVVESVISPRSVESSKTGSEEKDDTYDGTSSIAEDSVKDSPLDLDKSVPNSDKSTQSSERSLSETEFSPPILKDSKGHSKFDVSFDKLKLLPQKTEKLKSKSSLSSLADLPPLQLNKSRNDTMLLPSLYSKEFKEKVNNQNLKELDKFFDVDVDSLDNYEEDFMSESEINLNKSLDSARNTYLEESSLTDSNKNITSTSIKTNKSLSQNSQKLDFNLEKLNQKSDRSFNKEKLTEQNLKLNQNDGKSKTDLSPRNTGTSSVTSDDLNSNIEDILNSPTSS